MIKKSILLFTLILLMMSSIYCFTTQFSWALEGVEDGSGQNQEEGLVIVNCNVKNGQNDVPVDGNIDLEFNKNVVNMTVAENNKKCFSLLDQNGKSIPIQVIMGDDQVDATIKRLITVDPTENLAFGESYSLIISKDFTAKNGTLLGVETTLNFQTRDSAVINSNNELTDEVNGKVTDSGVALDEPDEISNQLVYNRSNIIMILSVLCILAGIILMVITIKRRQK